MPDHPIQPIYLFSDSQLLFWKEDNKPYLATIKRRLTSAAPKAAYIGASNGDAPEFFQIFVAAMESIGITNCRLIQSTFDENDKAFLAQADLVLLAGGEVRKGWEILKATGMKGAIIERYQQGALLIGISAGAIQLGRAGYDGEPANRNDVYKTLGLVPVVVGVREGGEWPILKQAVVLWDDATQGIGIPAGGGLIYHPDHFLEPIRHTAHEIWYKDEKITEASLLPGTAYDEETFRAEEQSQAMELATPEILDRPTIH